MERELGTKEFVDRERTGILQQYEAWVGIPTSILAFAWLALLIIDLTAGLHRFMTVIFNVIWITFILDFFIRLFLTPDRAGYLKRNWLSAVSLAMPALRVFHIVQVVRVLHAAHVAGGLTLFRVVTAVNRGMKTLSRSFGNRGFGYLAALTVLVLLIGAAGMYAFESRTETGLGLETYSDSLWWTAMTLTTLGSDYRPHSEEGRLLALLLSTYSIIIAGYFTAVLAAYFIGQEADRVNSKIAGQKSIDDLHAEVRALREELRRFHTASGGEAAE